MLKKLIMMLPAAAMTVGVAMAEDYPTRSISLVHGFAAGGNADVVARIVANEMSRGFGKPVVVEAKPGAGGNVASGYVSKSDPDGYTILLMVGGHTVSPALYNKLPYDPIDGFEFISTVGKFPFFVAARKGAYTSMQGVIEKAKAGRVMIGHSGVGTTQHLTGELLGSRTGAQFAHIPYKGGAAASTALLSGEVDLLIDVGTVIRGQADAGKFDVLGVSSGQRWPDSPNVPTIAETVSPGFDVVSWTGVGAPAGTPKPIVDKLRAEVHRVLALPEVQDQLRRIGAEPAPSSGVEMKAMIKDQIAVWTDVINKAGIQKR